MPHSYKLTKVSGGRVVQGDYHKHNEVHHHQHYNAGPQDSKEIAAIIAWLSTINFATTLQAHCNKRTPGTGGWLLEHEIFRKWMVHEVDGERALWCKGDPGVGKTILW